MASNAVRAFSIAAVRWHGNGSVNLPPKQWRVLDLAHRKRNIAEYEGDSEVDRSLVVAPIRVAQQVVSRVTELGPVPTDNDP